MVKTHLESFLIRKVYRKFLVFNLASIDSKQTFYANQLQHLAFVKPLLFISTNIR